MPLPGAVIWVAWSPVWTQMLPAFAYTSVPGTVIPVSGGGVATITSFDGVAVRAGTSSVPWGVAPPPPGLNGSSPLVRLSVTMPMTRRATTREHGRDRHAARQQPVGIAGRAGRALRRLGARAVARRLGHATPPPAGAATSTGTGVASARPAARARTSAARGWAPDAETSRTSSWSVSRPPNVRLARRATTSTRSPSDRPSARSGRPNAMPSRTSTLAAEHELGVAAVGGSDALHGQPKDGDQGLRVACAARRQAREVAVQAVVDERTAAGRGRRRAGAGRPPASRTPPRAEEAGGELGPAVGRQLEARRGGVAAVAHEEVVARIERVGEVEPPVAPARGADDVAIGRGQDGPDDRGPARSRPPGGRRRGRRCRPATDRRRAARRGPGRRRSGCPSRPARA